MKHTLLALSAACALTGCAGVKVAHTEIATGATDPQAIYIRSYISESAPFKGNHSHQGNKPLRRSLAPAEYSKALKEELEKMAPAMVLKDDEVPEVGWLVESEIDYVDAGTPGLRALPLFGTPGGVGQTKVKIHVRVTDLSASHSRDKDKGATGNVVYEFDLDGGSAAAGHLGSVRSSGLGYSPMFDYRNAAERVLYALSVDPHRYGQRESLTTRY